jgi:hypothetical protein
MANISSDDLRISSSNRTYKRAQLKISRSEALYHLYGQGDQAQLDPARCVGAMWRGGVVAK